MNKTQLVWPSFLLIVAVAVLFTLPFDKAIYFFGGYGMVRMIADIFVPYLQYIHESRKNNA